MRTVPRISVRTIVVAMGLAIVIAMPFATPALSAQEHGSLDVDTVNGREVSLTMSLDPSIAVSPDAQTTGTVEVDGRVIPATTRLVIPERPLDTAVLILDTSGSMKGARIDAAREASTAFVDAMPANLRVGLITFSDGVRVVSAPTLDRTGVLNGVRKAEPTGDTALYEAVIAGLSLVPASSSARLVVLSDGKDTTSSRSVAAVHRATAASGIPVDVIAVRPSAEELAILRGIATSSGGSVRTAATSDDLVSAFIAASKAFGPQVTMQARIPDPVDASGEPVTATVKVGPHVVEASTQLPIMTSLDALAVPAGTVDATGAAASTTAARGGDLVLPVGLGLVAAAAIMVLGLAAIRMRDHRRAVRRMDQVMAYRTGAHTGDHGDPARAERSRALDRLDAWLAGVVNVRRTESRLMAAEFSLTPAGWLLARLGAVVVLSLLLGLVLRSFVLGLVLGAVLAWVGSALVLRSRSTRRQRAFADALPDFLLLLASGLRSGLSFTHALESAAIDDTGEVGRQIRRALREVQVGANLDDALMECADRMDNDDLRWTVTALSIQREVGGNLSTILDTAASTIKARFELRREVRTLSAEGRLSGYILIALPIGVLAFLLVFRPEYMSLLWHDPVGILMLVAAGLALVVGWFWMRAIVRIKV